MDNAEFLQLLRKAHREKPGTYRNIRLPTEKHFRLSGDRSSASLRLSASAVVANMQRDEAAFEGWVMVLSTWCGVERFTIDWDQPDDPHLGKWGRHYQRFLYRLKHFQTLMGRDVIEVKRPERLEQLRVREGSGAMLNVATTAANEDGEGGNSTSEAALEILLTGEGPARMRLLGDLDLVELDRQFPVGVFDGKPSKATYLFPGGKSAIDLMGLGLDGKLWLFELKARGNIKVGSLSELFFYSMVLNDARQGRIAFDNRDPGSRARILPADVKKATHISARLLAPEYHPLLSAEVFAAMTDRAAHCGWAVDYGQLDLGDFLDPDSLGVPSSGDVLPSYSLQSSGEKASGKVVDYRAAQLNAQLAFLAASTTFSEDARAGGGIFLRKPRAFVLTAEHADENLFPPIRARARDYFARHSIKWHMANPHLLSSQVYCVNFLEPFAFEPRALRILLQNVLGPIHEMLEPEPDSDPGRFVSFEFIGARDYLNEGGKRGRARGAKCTSVDAALRFRLPDGSVEFALVEWKYTESYGEPNPLDPSNRERIRRYKNIAFHPDGPLRADCGVELGEFFTEPIYQLLRQQMLGMQMEKFQELEAKRVRTVLVGPSENVALSKLRINALQQFGTDVPSAWRALLYDPDRFIVCPTEELFRHAQATILESPGLEPWESYLGERYSLR